MEQSTGGLHIATSQNVAISYNPANIGERLLAWLLDSIFIAAYIFLIFLFLTGTHMIEDMQWSLIIFIIPALFYHLILELIFEGKSFGKMIVGIHVLKKDGSRPGVGAYVLRWLFGLLERNMPFGVVALIVILVNGKGQRIGDLAAGTAVVNSKQRVGLRDTILSQHIENYKIVYPQVSKISDKDFQIIKEVFETAMRTSNYKVINELALKTGELISVPPPQDKIKFLRTIIADYNHYQFTY